MKCCGCGKSDPVPPGATQPAGWVTSYNPLFGQPWEATGCSHRCVSEKRLQDIVRLRASAQIAR